MLANLNMVSLVRIKELIIHLSLLLQVLSLLANGEMVCVTEKEFNSGQMAANMKETGSMIKQMDLESFIMLTEISMKGIG